MKFLNKSLVILVIISFFSIFSLNNDVHTQADVLEVINPGEYIFETLSMTYSLDPGTYYDYDAQKVHELVYERLVTFDGNSAIDLNGELALNWTVSPDGLQYRFFLRSDVYFHDGVQFNAYVMKYCIDRMFIVNDPGGWILDLALEYLPGGSTYNSLEDQANVTHAINYLNAGAIQVIDDFELVINLARPYAGFPYFLTESPFSAISPLALIQNIPTEYTTDISNQSFGMVPLDSWFPGLDYRKLGLTVSHPHGISGVVPYSPDGLPNYHNWIQDNAIGTGPYEITNWNKSTEEIILGKFNSWWGTFSPESVDNIVFRVNADEITRLSNLEQGLVDQIYISPTTYSDLIANFPEGIDLYEVQRFVMYLLQINMNDSLEGTIQEDPSSSYNPVLWDRYHWGGVASADNPFTAHAFRLAFGLAFDYDNYLEVSSYGLGERLEGLIPNGMFGHNDQLIDQGYIPEPDLITAKTIFNQIGWRGNVSVSYNEGNLVRENISYSIKQAIEGLDVGITINVQPLSWPEYLTQIVSGNLSVYHMAWGADTADPDLILANFVHTTRGSLIFNMGYGNDTVDTKIDLAAEEQNPIVREQRYNELEELIAREHYFIYGFQRHEVYLVKDWIHNVESSGSLSPMAFMPNLEFIDKIELVSTTTTTTTTTDTTPITTEIATTEPYSETTTDNTSLETTTSSTTEDETQPDSTTTDDGATLTSPSFMISNVVIVLVIGSILSVKRKK